jgi:hypothetical protein
MVKLEIRAQDRALEDVLSFASRLEYPPSEKIDALQKALAWLRLIYQIEHTTATAPTGVHAEITSDKNPLHLVMRAGIGCEPLPEKCLYPSADRLQE